MEISNSEDFQNLVKYGKRDKDDKVEYYVKKLRAKYSDYDNYMRLEAIKMLESGRMQITRLDNDSSAGQYQFSLSSKKK